MPQDLLAYGLPLLAVAVVAVAGTLALRFGFGVARVAGTAVLARTGGQRGVRELALRRCELCGRGWRTDGRTQPSRLGLRLRRAVRRRARARERPSPRWARAQGWDRCPSCLSTRVRGSGEPALPAAGPSRWPVVWGFAAAGLGVLLLTIAVLGVLTSGSA